MLTSRTPTGIFDLPSTLMEHLETGQQWVPSDLAYEPPYRFDYLQKSQHLIIKVPHLREMHEYMCHLTGDAAWPCQKVFFRWLWAGVRPLARHIEKVEFQVSPLSYSPTSHDFSC